MYVMKRFILILLSIVVFMSANSQQDVTKFLGFPVDGTKDQMVKNLKTKGFKSIMSYSDKEVLTGRFNGMDVHLVISTEKGKVSRITLCDDVLSGERDIINRFNLLCKQFKENGKYFALADYTIQDNEDISHEMLVNNKRYEATFYQLPEGELLKSLQESIINKVRSNYTLEQLESNNEEIKKQVIIDCVAELLKEVEKKPVWFMITQDGSRYYITMHYDNEYNRANGEDL